MRTSRKRGQSLFQLAISLLERLKFLHIVVLEIIDVQFGVHLVGYAIQGRSAGQVN